MKKKIYCITFNNDFGELWLDDNKTPIAQIDPNDGHFRKEYYSFIFDTLNVEFIVKYLTVADDFDEEKFFKVANDPKKVAKLFKKEIDKLLL